MSDFTLHRAAIATRPRLPILHRVMAALDVWRSRQHLKGLEAHRLDDIGIARKDASVEANRPIWDVPQHWLQ